MKEMSREELLDLYKNYKPKKVYNAVKRVIDFVLSLVLLVILAIPIAIISFSIKVSSKGSVFYRGERGGYKNKPFRIFKFRSMVENAENIGGGTTRLGDPRITKVGKVLRKLKLDETANLINIVRGEMSFVGPRPELLRYTDKYEGMEKIIFDVRPGITDISSLKFISLDEIVGSGDADSVYEECVLEKKNLLRCEYVLKQSFFLDCYLFMMTVWFTVKKAFDQIFKKEENRGVKA